MTLIAVSIWVASEPEVDDALAKARQAAEAGARLVEWRVDALDGDGVDVIAAAIRLIKDSPLPCIITRRPTSEGGMCSETDIQRSAFFGGVANSGYAPKYLDIELASFREDKSHWSTALSNDEKDASLILSSHDFDGRPRDLFQRIEEITNEPACDVIKIVWAARSLRDNLEAFDLLTERKKPMIALCMGQFGLMSRVLAPKFGGFLTFACMDKDDATATGQPTINELIDLYRFDQIGLDTKVYGVIGWPVEHSLSPKIHNAGFCALGHDGVYLPMPLPPEYEHFKATVGSFVDHERLDFRGASVTIPHKENLLRFVSERGGMVDPLAEKIGAANTLVIDDDGVVSCFNTDAPAAIESLCDGAGIKHEDLKNRRIAVIGAGGVARAVIAGLCDADAKVTIFNRTPRKAEALAELFHAEVGGKTPLELDKFEIYINCTSLGMAGGPAPDQSPLPLDAPLDKNTVVFDTVYTPQQTPLIKQAEAAGAKTISGIEMFLRQASLQFERWTCKEAPMEVFRKALNK
ncbi:MAG: shikimate dehydrogenase [Planctomycetes bacterium]|nr:shikimate dehydrogenase [Planctomycetota bacterium]